jgi:hypothetical protein
MCSSEIGQMLYNTKADFSLLTKQFNHHYDVPEAEIERLGQHTISEYKLKPPRNFSNRNTSPAYYATGSSDPCLLPLDPCARAVQSLHSSEDFVTATSIQTRKQNKGFNMSRMEDKWPHSRAVTTLSTADFTGSIGSILAITSETTLPCYEEEVEDHFLFKEQERNNPEQQVRVADDREVFNLLESMKALERSIWHNTSIVLSGEWNSKSFTGSTKCRHGRPHILEYVT